MKDYYLILGVPKDCSQEDIKKAYRKLARQYHPDTSHQKDSSQFCDVQEAYENIGTAEKRKAYDEKLRKRDTEKLNEIKISHRHKDYFKDYAHPNRINFSSFINNGFEGPFADRILEIVLTPEEAFSGTMVSLKIPIEMECPDCHGFGSLGFFSSICSTCGGAGAILWHHPLTINIAPGIKPNTRFLIKIANKMRIQAIVTIQ